ncbi:UDP-glucose 4-epimerase [Micromonospora viridifaciens]|uniref:UDP-glucose 4-epimerase n=1 Tax=Micromonospora viridifaciens TaxID=1881 RepID=A0A1C4YXU9_MICVI|nr:NAD-dependent epimerase/dehydratase family protein [Micromonospora viridifaciens]SCF25563.1 UDP-glucose 4-epimerase [Micromonospora viridifaciens]
MSMGSDVPSVALSSATVLVTGGAGFIGSHLAERLVSLGAQVVVLDNFRNGSRANLGFPGAESMRVIEGDILDPEVCRQAVTGVDVVFHLACLGVRHSLHSPVENHQVNALGTLNVLEAARAAEVSRLVYVSTSEVYGRALEFPITEETTPWPLTVYGGSKLAGEHYARSYQECWQLPVVCVRPFNNYGPRSHSEGDSGEVIPRFILRALVGQPPVVFGDGRVTRDFLYVQDCAATLARIAESTDLVGEVVNLGYGEELSIGLLAETVLEAVGRADLSPVFEAPRPADVPRLWVDTGKLRKAIDFAPQVPLSEGIGHTVDYFARLLREQPAALERMQTRNWSRPA